MYLQESGFVFSRLIAAALIAMALAANSIQGADESEDSIPTPDPALSEAGPRPLSGAAREKRIAELSLRLARPVFPGSSRNPKARLAFVEDIREWQDLRRNRAIEKAAQMGIPADGTLPSGRRFSVIDYDENRLLYRASTNIDAAISTAADLVRSTAPFHVDGFGLTLGLWDPNLVLATHQELAGRIIIAPDNFASVSSHATHVAGTMIAAGVNPLAKGMAPAASLISYDWNNDASEMAGIGASYPGESGKIPLSNHSYADEGGWEKVGSPTHKWLWRGAYSGGGSQASNVETRFGRYDLESPTLDAVVASTPYYLPFFSAGNERDDQPTAGETWKTPSDPTIHTYNPLTDPLGDFATRNGYDTMMMRAVAKNVLTVGAVNDATNASGTRSLAAATMTAYSSWGPADDGRVKPDIVANGQNLYSSTATSNTAYGTFFGTSMSTPNASGSAALLVDLFDKNFPQSAMRASTLKGLIIHTADDLGTAGPDYKFGWGLMNTLAAAQLINSHATTPGERRLLEGRLTATKTSEAFSFLWDGVSPIRVTLAWTDPPGPAISGHDIRTAALVNDLDLLVTGPTSTLYRPFVMPFVGTWTTASMATAATTGVNTVDNVEQVLLGAPGVAGLYTISISLSGTLIGSEQAYSLIVSGAGESNPSDAPTIAAYSFPTACGTGNAFVNVDGTRFQLGGSLHLARGGFADVASQAPEVFADHARGQFDLGPLAPGSWNLAIANPDGQTAVVPSVVEIPVTADLLNQDFESGFGSWTTSSSGSGNDWVLYAGLSSSPVTSVYGEGTIVQSHSSLLSPEITFPADATCISLSFQQMLFLSSGIGDDGREDAGVLEVSFDSGSIWYDITAVAGTFLEGGYNNTLNTVSNPLGPNGKSVWTGSTATFFKTQIVLDARRYAGLTVCFRWRLGCDAGSRSLGWLVDDIRLQVDVSSLWSAFDFWRYNTLGDAFADESVDSEGDGLDLFGEYSFAGDPDVHDGSIVTVGQDGGYLTITFPIRREATDVTYTVRTGATVGSWTDAAVYTSDGHTAQRNSATGTVQVSITSDGTRMMVTERSATPISSEPQRFLKVVATRTPP